MSTSYTKIILFLVGIIFSSLPVFAQDSEDSSPYLNCSITPGGVPVGVVDLCFPQLERHDKLSYIAQILDKENKAAKGKFECHAAGYRFTEAESHCPIGQYWVCAKNSADSPNPNSPYQLGPDAARGNHHGYIELSEEKGDCKHGLEDALKKEGFFKKDFADATNYSGGIKRDDNGRLKGPDACIAYNYTDDWGCGQSFAHAQNFYAPVAPAVPMVQKPEPPEDYKNPTDNSSCSGTLNCAQAQACRDKVEYFKETCGGPNCSVPKFSDCLRDYNKFCGVSNGLCGNTQLFTPPAHMLTQAGTAIEAIDKIRVAAQGLAGGHFTQCALFAVQAVPAKGQTPQTNADSTYKKCVNGNDAYRKYLSKSELNLDYLELVLKSFNDPISVKDFKQFNTDHLLALATALSKLASTEPQIAYATMGYSDASKDLKESYNDLAKAVIPLIGQSAAVNDRTGTLFGFAIDTTKGGKGYLGIAPVTQNSGALPKTYREFMESLSATENPPVCLLESYKTKENQEKQLKAIIRDYKVAQAIKAGLATCPIGGATAKPGGANSKLGGKTITH